MKTKAVDMSKMAVVKSKVFHLPDGRIFLLTTLKRGCINSDMITRENQSSPHFIPDRVPTFAGNRPSGTISDYTPPYKRCQICRCPILMEGDFFLCAGCGVDQMEPISRILRKRQEARYV